jgi:serine/threonine protein kinase
MSALAVSPIRALRDGGQKTVKLVDHAGVERVLKVIAVDSATPDALKRARREVELLGKIDDANVVKVASDLVELGDPVRGAAWLEQYLDGQDLIELVGNPWTWDETYEMARDVASGLAALHAVNVVHRDLSANNIRRTSDGRYVVMDPGFARHTLRSGLTVGGQPGTAGFLSPEHLNMYSGVPNAASDSFCVGILMFLALTGHLPIEVSDGYLERLSRAETTGIRSLRTDLPDRVVELLQRCLHPQSARRPLDGTQLLEAVEAAR